MLASAFISREVPFFLSIVTHRGLRAPESSEWRKEEKHNKTLPRFRVFRKRGRQEGVSVLTHRTNSIEIMLQ
jgi:hypothetical protein